jgi:hypothetical protein
VAYYSTIAQVLPVLLLVLLFEVRVSRLSPDPEWNHFLQIVAIVFVVGGEAASLHGLSTGVRTGKADGLIVGAFVFGGVSIFGSMGLDVLARSDRLRDSPLLGVSYLVLLVALLLVLGFAVS